MSTNQDLQMLGHKFSKYEQFSSVEVGCGSEEQINLDSLIAGAG